MRSRLPTSPISRLASRCSGGRRYRPITLNEERFGIEPEIAAKIARMKLRIKEVPISYRGRGYHEGKKIGWLDGVRAIFCVVRYNFFR